MAPSLRGFDDTRSEREGQIWVFFKPEGYVKSYFWQEEIWLPRKVVGKHTWCFDFPFENKEDAIDAAKAVRKACPSWRGTIRVAKAWKELLWEDKQSDMSPLMGDCSSFEIMVKKMVAKEGFVYHWNEDELMPAPAGEKESHVSDIKKPLHIPRKTLVARLEEVLREKEQVRSDAEAEFTERRAKYTAAIKDFTDDELTNIIDSYVHMHIDELKKAKEAKRFVSVDSKPTPVEDQLAKQVRVLKMASDEDIEIAPSDNLYPLL